jgi:hypothetical protein
VNGRGIFYVVCDMHDNPVAFVCLDERTWVLSVDDEHLTFDSIGSACQLGNSPVVFPCTLLATTESLVGRQAELRRVGGNDSAVIVLRRVTPISETDSETNSERNGKDNEHGENGKNPDNPAGPAKLFGFEHAAGSLAGSSDRARLQSQLHVLCRRFSCRKADSAANRKRRIRRNVLAPAWHDSRTFLDLSTWSMALHEQSDAWGDRTAEGFLCFVPKPLAKRPRTMKTILALLTAPWLPATLAAAVAQSFAPPAASPTSQVRLTRPSYLSPFTEKFAPECQLHWVL